MLLKIHDQVLYVHVFVFNPSLLSMWICLLYTIVSVGGKCFFFLLLSDSLMKSHVNFCLSASSATLSEHSTERICCLIEFWVETSFQLLYLFFFFWPKDLDITIGQCFYYIFFSSMNFTSKTVLKPSSRKASSNFCIFFLSFKKK